MNKQGKILMEENDRQNVRHIMRLYQGKHFSRKGRSLFGRWLRAESQAEDKSQALLDLWNAVDGTATAETQEDWNALRMRMAKDSTRGHHLIRYASWMRYAAMIALIASVGAVAFLLFQPEKHIERIEMAELFVPYGESQQILLPDSSKVWVEAGSLLVYPKDFAILKTRMVYLTGEASFSVAKNKEKPFIVNTTDLDVKALGTVFTVSSYPTDSYTSAMLEEGSVQVNVKNGEQRPETILSPHEELVYSRLDNTVTIQKANVSAYGMKRKGYQIYEDISFGDLMTALERKYNVTIQYSSEKYAQERYNVKFAPHETLEDALEVLRQLAGIRYEIKEKTVFIH